MSLAGVGVGAAQARAMTAAVATPVGRNERMSTSLHLLLVGRQRM
jgi:hypothetical protein